MKITNHNYKTGRYRKPPVTLTPQEIEAAVRAQLASGVTAEEAAAIGDSHGNPPKQAQ